MRPNPVEKFYSKIKFPSDKGCWIWKGALDKDNYGLFSFSLGFKTKRAPRVSYFIHSGKIPGGLHVLHRCDNRRCVNPEHLFLGTHLENVEDMRTKGRSQRWQAYLVECKNGHSFDRINTGIRKNGNRYCKKCVRIRTLKNKQKEFINASKRG